MKRQLGLFNSQCLPRATHYVIWPDPGHILHQAEIERVNIHIPDLARMAQALNKPNQRSFDWKSCISYQKAVQEVFPGHKESWLVEGVCEYYKGDSALAELSLNTFVHLRPGSFWAHYNLGMFYFNDCKYEMAAGELARAVKLGQEYDGASWLSSKVISNIIQADDVRDTAQSFALAYLHTLQAAALVAVLTDDCDAAQEYAAAGLRFSNSNRQLMLITGWALLCSGKPQDARAKLQLVIDKYPSEGAAYYLQALAFRDLKDDAGFKRLSRMAGERKFDMNRYLARWKFPLRLY